MTKSIGIIILCYFGLMQIAWAVSGTESMDRPSAKPLPLIPDRPDDGENRLILPPAPKIRAYPDSSDKIFIKRIRIEGNTVFSDLELKKLIKDYESRVVSIAEIEAIRQKLTHYYIDQGYINSGAMIPADAINNGELRIIIIEGRLNEIKVSGQERLREGYIKNRLLENPDKPFNINDMQERFQNLLSDPLISRMNGRILPGNSLGQSVLDLEVIRAKPYHLSLFGDNYRPPSIGGEAFGLEGWVRNLTGLGDMLDFTFINSEGSNRYSGGFSVPLSDLGTLGFFHFDEGDSSVIEGSVKGLNIKSQVHNLEGGISHPVINKLNQRLTLGIVLAVRENESSLLGHPFTFVQGEPTGRNQTTVWRIFQEGMWRGNNQALVLRSTFNVGMNALGSTPKTSNKFPSSEFFSWLGQGQYAYRLIDNGAQVVFRGNAQFSDSPLLPLEQIAIGGVSTVRGYRENSSVRDNGYSLSLELHYPMLGNNDSNSGHNLTLIPFFDYGEAWNVSDANENSRNTLYSVGLGFNWTYKMLSADINYGYALNTPPTKTQGDIQDKGIHFRVRLNVF